MDWNAMADRVLDGGLRPRHPWRRLGGGHPDDRRPGVPCGPAGRCM